MNGKVAIFSGRFSPIHIGHVLTILKLLDKYSSVVVVILDYEDRTLTADEVKSIVERIFEHNSKGRVIAIVNNIHFAKITKKEYLSLLSDFDINVNDAIYVSGNEEVLKNFDKLGIEHEHMPRSCGFSGTEIRETVADIHKYYSMCS